MKTFKTILVLALALILSTEICAQDKNKNAGRIAIQVEMPKNLSVSNDASLILFNRLTQAVALNGYGSTSSKFLMVPIVTLISKDITTNIPQQVVVDLELSLFIVDNSTRTILQQESINLKGIAESEQKAILKAISNLKARHPKLKNAIVRGKEKIVAYYETQCDDVIKSARTYLERGMDFEAMQVLMNVPATPETMGCYESAQNMMSDIEYDARVAAEAKAAELPQDVEWLTNSPENE